MSTGRNGRDALTAFQVAQATQSSYAMGKVCELPGRIADLEALKLALAGKRLAVGYVRHTGASADTETVTINGRVYEYDTNGAITGDVAVDISGGNSAAQSATALALAINTDTSADVDALVAADGTTVILVGRTAATAFSLDETLGNGSVSAAALIAGLDAADRQLVFGRYVVTAADVAQLATGGEIVVGCLEDPGSTPDLVNLLAADAAGSFYSVANLGFRIAQVNTNNYALLLRDPGAVLSATDQVRYALGA